jgi:hypothetical protein
MGDHDATMKFLLRKMSSEEKRAYREAMLPVFIEIIKDTHPDPYEAVVAADAAIDATFEFAGCSPY